MNRRRALVDGRLNPSGASDTAAPSVQSFTATTPSSSLTVTITAFTADADAAAFIITENSTPPAVDAAGWSETAQTEHTVSAAGIYTLYPWAKDAAGNVSSEYGSPASVDVSTLYANLTVLWHLNEVSDGSAPVTRADSKGSNTLADNGTTASGTGKLGDAGVFVVADQTSLSIADNTDLSMGDINFTWLVWIKTGASVSGTQMCLAKWTGSAGRREYQLYIYNTQFNFEVRNTADDASGSVAATTLGNLSVNTWYLVEISHDADNNKLYISGNGGARNETDWTGGVLNGVSTFRLGAAGDTANSWLGGLADEIGLWKGRVLSLAEIDESYGSGNGRALNP